MLQGYHFAKPMPASVFSTYLSEQFAEP